MIYFDPDTHIIFHELIIIIDVRALKDLNNPLVSCIRLMTFFLKKCSDFLLHQQYMNTNNKYY